MDYGALVKFVQGHFTDGLVLVIGSGLSSAEGIPGMPQLAAHLNDRSTELAGAAAALWQEIVVDLEAEVGLETALLNHSPTDELEAWISQETSALLIPKEREIIGAVVQGSRTLRLTKLLDRVLKPANGLPILTPNYDRLIEVACEMSGFHVDTTAVGHYAGAFDPARSSMQSCRRVIARPKNLYLDHYPRAVVLKPHGSFDWYKSGGHALRCSLDLDAERLIITPGLNKYRAGYNSPFDKHRELANEYIRRAARFLIVGYGFNDDHLQTHLLNRIVDGTPTLILNRSIGTKVKQLAMTTPHCICLSQPTASCGVAVTTFGHQLEHHGSDLWDIGILAEELLT